VPPSYGGTYGTDQTSKQTTLQGFALETLDFFNDRLQLTGGLSRYYGNLTRTDRTNTALNKDILLAAPSYSLLTNAQSLGIVVKADQADLALRQSQHHGRDDARRTRGRYLSREYDHLCRRRPAPCGRDGHGVQAYVGSQDEFGVKTSMLNGTITGSLSYFEISQQNYPVPNSDYYTLIAR